MAVVRSALRIGFPIGDPNAEALAAAKHNDQARSSCSAQTMRMLALDSQSPTPKLCQAAENTPRVVTPELTQAYQQTIVRATNLAVLPPVDLLSVSETANPREPPAIVQPEDVVIVPVVDLARDDVVKDARDDVVDAARDDAVDAARDNVVDAARDDVVEAVRDDAVDAARDRRS